MYLIAGGLGFIGLNFLEFCIKKNLNVLVIDSLTYAANKDSHNFFKKNKIRFIKCNIGNKKKISKILKSFKISKIINFAAETHVDNSIVGPEKFIKSNIIDFYNFLEETKKYYENLNLSEKKKFRFLQVSTDEVFGSLKPKEAKFTENSKFFPNNPYSATKAAGDLIARAWFKTFDLPILVTNCSNNYGKFQHKEKLIPKIIFNAIKNKTIPIYGNGKNLREWLFVQDHCDAIFRILQKGKIGQTYNIGSLKELTNIELAKKICKKLDSIHPKLNGHSYNNQIKFVKDRKAHDKRYAINSKKIRTELNWRPKISFDKGLDKTIKFYLKQFV